MPASTRILRWCETVGWVRPSGSVRSQTQASPAACAATMETSRSRTGSASALSSRARLSAWSGVRGSWSSGAQQASARGNTVIGSVTPSSMRQALTDVYSWGNVDIDERLCLWNCLIRSATMPGASPQTRRVKVLNANWTPSAEHGAGTFELMLITDDDRRHTAVASPAEVSALTALAQA